MNRQRPSPGFSLLEVVIASGIFAGTVVVIIALMAMLSRQATQTTESLAARCLPDAVKVELDRLARAGMDGLAGQIPVMAIPLGDGLKFAAAKDVAEVQSLAYLPPATGRLLSDEQYYLIECWRFPEEPLRYDASKAFLPLLVRVSWPFRLPGLAAPVAPTDRSQITFVVSINR
jgi:hypothetical protein